MFLVYKWKIWSDCDTMTDVIKNMGMHPLGTMNDHSKFHG